MRRRLITGFFLLDGLCAVLAPVAASSLQDAPEQAAYLVMDGMCLEEDRSNPELVAWRAVPMGHCSAS